MTRPQFRPKAVLAGLIVYGAVVAAVAFWPTPVDRPISGLLRRVLARLHDVGIPAWFDYAFVEFSANVLLFVPIGFLLAALLGLRQAWVAVTFGALASVTVECAQWLLLPERYPSVADVFANTAGVIVGVAAFLIMLKSERLKSPG